MDNQSSYRKRIIIVGAIFTAMALGVISNLAYWQLIDPKDYTERQIGQSPLPAKRGTIFDVNGHILASDIVEYTIGVSPSAISGKSNAKLREYLANQLATILTMSKSDIMAALNKTDKAYIPLRQEPVPLSDATQIRAIKLDAVIKLDAYYRRSYPEHTLAAHVIGLTQIPDDASGLLNRVGVTGIEGYYDDRLEGTIGAIGQNGFQWDILTGKTAVTEAIAGDDIYLTIDRPAQNIVETELANALQLYGARAGRAIVMNPKNGAILAMADTQTYDPNHRESYSNTDNNNISRAYEPGSVFKIFTIASALDAGVIGPATTVNDIGAFEIDANNSLPNSDNQAHGVVDVTTILAKSLNMPTAQIANTTGAETFYNYVRRFGLGSITDIDLLNESTKPILSIGNEGWYEADLAYNAIGQGLQVTPIQLITAVSAVANHGLMMKPHVVDRIVSYDGKTIEPVEAVPVRNVIRSDTADVLTHILANAIEMSNSAAQISGYRIAGKTGTAEFIDPKTGTYDKSQSIDTFAGYFPVDDPQLVILVILDQPTQIDWASHTAAPTFSAIGTQLARLYNIPPDNVQITQVQ